MLSRAHRATSYDLAHMGRGRVVRTPHLLFSYVPAPGKPSKIACSIAKKVAPRAVDRNLAKRRCRTALRELMPQLPLPILGIVRITDRSATIDDMRAEVAKLFASTKPL